MTSREPFAGVAETPYSQHPYAYALSNIAKTTFVVIMTGYSQHPYAYALSNPVRYGDPSGRFCWDINASYDLGTTCNHVSVATQISVAVVDIVPRYSAGFVQHGIDAVTGIAAFASPERYRAAWRGVDALYYQPQQSWCFLQGAFLNGYTLAHRGTDFLTDDPVGAAISLSAEEWGGITFDVASTYFGIKGIQGAAALRAAREVEVLGAAGKSAQSAAQGALLRRALSFEEPFSNFTSTGELNPEVIVQSERIIAGSDLRNPAVINELTSDGSNIADWGKWESPTSGSPLENFRIHFYRNEVTGKVNYNVDYKVKFAIPGQPEMPVSQFLDALRRLMNATP